jgi:hypothetical protein
MAIDATLKYQSPSQKAYGNSVLDRVTLSDGKTVYGTDPKLGGLKLKTDNNQGTLGSGKATETLKKTEMNNTTNDNNTTQRLGKAIAISQVGGIVGIIYAFKVKSGFWKGAGYYLLGGMVGGLAGMAYYNFTAK